MEMNTLEGESEELIEDLKILRESIRTEAEKPEAFWASQRAGIAARTQKSVSLVWRRPALLWAPGILIVVMCFYLFLEKGETPKPDFAAGADQILLVEVEQALRRDCPEALAPAAHITQQIDQVSGTREKQPMAKR
jgi:hypothetical protein